jgi:hypothetical protein
VIKMRMKCGKGLKEGRAGDGWPPPLFISESNGEGGGKGERVRSLVACCEQGREMPKGLAYVTLDLPNLETSGIRFDAMHAGEKREWLDR